jgi:cytochrome c
MRNAWIAVVLVAVMAGSASAQQAPQRAQAGEGEQLFNLVCAMCHSVEPPAKTAPPMAHAAAYYVRKFPEPSAAVAAMVAFMKEPSAERSALPAHAIERFGLMPSLAHLSDAQLQAVSRYVLTLADTAHVHGGHGGSHGGGGK